MLQETAEQATPVVAGGSPRPTPAGGMAPVVRGLFAAEEAHDPQTAMHSSRVVELSRRVGRALGLDGPKLRHVSLVALLHDVGKVRVPQALLDKPAPLTRSEWARVRRHPVDGAEMVSVSPQTAHLATAIRASHERWDGGGYPDGLAGEAIPLASRIGFVCDSFDAMTSHRPYRRAMPVGAALDEIARESGRQFCPRAARALLALETLPWRTLGAPRPH